VANDNETGLIGRNQFLAKFRLVDVSGAFSEQQSRPRLQDTYGGNCGEERPSPGWHDEGVKTDPLLPLPISSMNGREARESGLWLKAWV
jgi:hypothetical protein